MVALFVGQLGKAAMQAIQCLKISSVENSRYGRRLIDSENTSSVWLL